VDPFASTADPAGYLPREATDRALERLEAAFRQGRRVQVLSGPAGIGKTLVMHVLAERLGEDFRSVYLPYASLGWQDLCCWVLGLLREPPGPFPDRELLASARRSALHGQPLLLLVDEASSIPPETARSLAELVREAEGALRLLLVPADEARTGRVLAALARESVELRLSAPLTLEETELYLRTRLLRAQASPEEAARFDADTVARIYRAAGGNPRRVQQLAGEVLRGNLAALPGAEALEALGAAPEGVAALEVDAAEEGGALAAASPAAAAAVLAPAPGAPSEATAPAPPAAGARAAQPPLGPPEPEATNWWIVGVVNLAILIGMLAGLWFGGFLPPPR
jgi:type II secretory pathway predicted ATPase ExeA